MYDALYKNEQLIKGKGNDVAIITGWTVKEYVAKKIDAENYAVIGQLYSPARGINLLFRNLLYNPQIKYVVALEATKEDANSGNMQALRDFWTEGFREGKTKSGLTKWVINSDIEAYLDYEIREEDLKNLRDEIDFYCFDNLENIFLWFSWLKRQPRKERTIQDRLKFPESKVNEGFTIPDASYGHKIEADTIAAAWIEILHRIRTYGHIRKTGYGGEWQEVIDLMVVVKDEPLGFYFPSPNYLPVDREFINEKYKHQILDDAKYVEGVKYTYGQRLRSWFGVDQIKQVCQKLVKEPDAASAVMSLWDVKDHEKGGSPCLNHIWVRIVNNELSLTATFRSNDMFSAWVSNAMGLRLLQLHILEQLRSASIDFFSLQVGKLITISQSAHIYDDSWENIEGLLLQHRKTNPVYFDSVGNFVIEKKVGAITVFQYAATDGSLLKVYSGRNPLKLIREITYNCPTIKSDHIGYLGLELQKAVIALKENKTYIQDRNNV